jgi:hypothetical protein
MANPIKYEAQTDRELLVLIAERINSLNDKTADLCVDVKEHGAQIAEGASRISAQEVKVVEVIRDTSETLISIHGVMDDHSERIGNLEKSGSLNTWMIRSLWAVVAGVIMTIVTLFWQHITAGVAYLLRFRVG